MGNSPDAEFSKKLHLPHPNYSDNGFSFQLLGKVIHDGIHPPAMGSRIRVEFYADRILPGCGHNFAAEGLYG